MIYRAKVGLQNTKQVPSYSPLYSPSNQKKTSALKQNKFSPKPTHRENKENLDQKEPKLDRLKQEKYFKISKDQTISSVKKQQKTPKISISISTNETKNSAVDFEQLNLPNIETPKFKCSSNKIDDRCKTEQFFHNDNYFSFGDDFRENIKLNSKPSESTFFLKQKKGITPLKEKNKNLQEGSSQKVSIDTMKKKQKMKQGEQKLELRLFQHERQIKESKYKRDRDIFYFKK